MTVPLAHLRPILRRVFAACALTALLAAPARADDGDLPPRLQRPDAIRGTLSVYVPHDFFTQPGDAFAGATYAHQLTRATAWQVSAGGSTTWGAHVGTGLRFTALAAGAHGLTFGVGGHVAFFRHYGPVAFGDLDVAWELRSKYGPSLLLGGGVGVVLNDSKRIECTSGLFLCEYHSFDSGDGGARLLAELGWAF